MKNLTPICVGVSSEKAGFQPNRDRPDVWSRPCRLDGRDPFVVSLLRVRNMRQLRDS